MAPSSRVLESGRPEYTQPEDITRPELYFSPSLSGYAVAGSEQAERPCAGGSSADYEGTAGVEMSSFVRRAAFALAFLDYNVLGSGAIEADSQMLWVRNVRDRLEKLAPFLSYDGDPYPVVVEGRVKWVVDAYTSSSRYPYAQRIGTDVRLTDDSGIDTDANYVRNSVKAVIDAYDGSATFYVNDPDDPIIKAWQGAFGDLFTPGSEMPAELREHLRYPEDLFRVQTDVYSKYQLEPEQFFQRQGAWSVAQAPSINPRETAAAATPAPSTNEAQAPAALASEAATSRFTPYYTMFRDMDSDDEDFVILRPFVPFSSDDRRTELQAYMTASSDPDNYGQLTAYVLDDPPDGPRTVSNNIDSEPAVAATITQLTGGGNQVRFGDLQIVPVADGLLWVRPMYAVITQDSDGSPGSGVGDFRFVIASYNDNVAIGTSLGEALAGLFDGFDVDLGDRVGAGDGSTPEDEETGDQPAATTPEEALARADELLREAEAALEDDNDLGEYQAKVAEATALVNEALNALQPATTTPAGEPSTDTTAPATTAPSTDGG